MTTRARVLRRAIAQLVVMCGLLPFAAGFVVQTAAEPDWTPEWIPSDPPTPHSWPRGTFGCADPREWWEHSEAGTRRGDDAAIQGWMTPIVYSDTRPGAPISPKSAAAVTGRPYCFEAGHCGLAWIVDFDGSFWEVIQWDPSDPPSNLGGLGSIRLVNPDRAEFIGWRVEDIRGVFATGRLEYTDGWGKPVTLRRIEGSIVPAVCW